MNKKFLNEYFLKVREALEDLKEEKYLKRYKNHQISFPPDPVISFTLLVREDIPKLKIVFLPEGEKKEKYEDSRKLVLPIDESFSSEEIKEILKNQITTRVKGFSNEILIERILSNLKEKGRIKNFRKARPEEDRKGIDFVIYWFNDQEVPIQIKSSEGGQTYHMTEFKEIPSIKLDLSEDKTSEKLVNIVKEFLKEGRVLHI